jgi:VanZ family protein
MPRFFALGGRRRWAGAAALIAAFIFLQSSLPAASVDDPPLSLIFSSGDEGMTRFWDEVASSIAHLVMYFALGHSLLRASGQWSPRASAWSCALAVLYGAGDELHQALVPERTASLFDLGLDSIGAVLGTFGARWLRKRICVDEASIVPGQTEHAGQ